ncbi:MAG: redoxin domain-containing protein [Dehalococcoidia bacterium]|nr:redoxin domain-containing protein [Dehalococcoidia bacterium]
MAAWQKDQKALAEMGVAIVGASVEPKEVVQEMATKSGVSFPMAYGVTREDADGLGSWWSDDRGGYIQPTEFLLGRGGTVLGAMYASGPVGRISPDEAVHFIESRERRRLADSG